MSKQNQVTLLLAQGQSVAAAAQTAQVDEQTIRDWLEEGDFSGMLDQIKTLVQELRQRLLDRGLQVAALDDEVADQLYEWALVAGLVTPRPIPAARPARHRPWLRLLKEI